ncbi:hypothetical protein TIFTF001_014528 [Ficus carica]|uniref:CCHC-type domain-containing protein n=1 Tax=Ficus carica TaxID=3494 RepID=A0AA88A681_FICCA|nr:hypothetical protein TIFTF001_014528 [Ficus carica]
MLPMDEDTKISYHLSILNGIIFKLEAIRVKIDDANKTLRFIWSLPPSNEHIKPVLIYGKKTVNFVEVIGKLLYDERRLKSVGNALAENSVLVASNGKKKNLMKNVICWGCGQYGHLKKNCRGGADAVESSRSEANSVSFFMGDDNVV